MVERRGCQVEVAGDGAEGLPDGPVHRIRSDPDGLPDARNGRLRSHPDASRRLGERTPPVVAVTARAMEEDRRNASSPA